MKKSTEAAITGAFPGDHPHTKAVRSAVLNLYQMAERAELSLLALGGQLALLIESPISAALDGVMAEDAEMLAMRMEALGMEIRVVARRLGELKGDWKK